VAVVRLGTARGDRFSGVGIDRVTPASELLDDSALQNPDTTDVYELIVERHLSAATVVTSNREPQFLDLQLCRKQLSEAGLDAGADTIGWHLTHHHATTVSRATINRILVRAGCVTPEPAKRPSPRSRRGASLPVKCALTCGFAGWS
jgi:hypothetical protein